MGIKVHHLPVDRSLKWTLHSWQGSSASDATAVEAGDTLDFELPDNIDPRKLRFKFYSTDAKDSHLVTWEPDDFVRIIRLQGVSEIWTFGLTGRVLYADPFPPDRRFREGDTVTFNLVTQNRFKGGSIYLWNPYRGDHAGISIAESSRADATSTSTFTVRLAD